MILRRVIAHFRRQEWTAIFLDFVIVVIGVFVGLQAQEWSKNFSDRQREAQIMARDLPSAPGLNPPRPIPVRAPGRSYGLSDDERERAGLHGASGNLGQRGIAGG